MTDKQYSLQFSGLDTDSQEQLSRFKAICIAELDLSIEDTQNLLVSQETRIVKTSASLPDLREHYEKLRSAGAKVAILTPDGTEAPTEMDSREDELVMVEADRSGDNELSMELEDILNFDIELLPQAQSPKKRAAEPKEYTLNLEEAGDDLAAIVSPDGLAGIGDELFLTPAAEKPEALATGGASNAPVRTPVAVLPNNAPPTPSAATLQFNDLEDLTHALTDIAFGETVADPIDNLISAVASPANDASASSRSTTSKDDGDGLELTLGPAPEELLPAELDLSGANGDDSDDDALTLNAIAPMSLSLGKAPSETVAPGMVSAMATAGPKIASGTVAQSKGAESKTTQSKVIEPTSAGPDSLNALEMELDKPAVLSTAGSHDQAALVAQSSVNDTTNSEPLFAALPLQESSVEPPPPGGPSAKTIAPKSVTPKSEAPKLDAGVSVKSSLAAEASPPVASPVDATSLKNSTVVSAKNVAPVAPITSPGQSESAISVAPTKPQTPSKSTVQEEVAQKNVRSEALPETDEDQIDAAVGEVVTQDHPPELAALSRNQMFAVLAAGIVLLLAGNWFLGPSPEVPALPQIGEVSTAPGGSGKSKGDGKNSAQKPPPELPKKLGGEIKTDAYTLTFSASPSGEEFTARLTFTTPQPAELTLEEIGRAEKPRIWLRRAESDAVTLKRTADNELSGSTPIYVFVERGAERKRLPAVGLVSLTMANDNRSGEAKIDISYTAPGDTTLPADHTIIEAAENGTYRVHAAVTLPVKIQ